MRLQIANGITLRCFLTKCDQIQQNLNTSYCLLSTSGLFKKSFIDILISCEAVGNIFVSYKYII